MMILRDVYSNDRVQKAYLLYELLKRRKPNESISHKSMPTWEEHQNFINSRPYKGWYILALDFNKDEDWFGSIYLSKKDEIGIHLWDSYQKQGFGRLAIQTLMLNNPDVRTFYANINPLNFKSIKFFLKLGFLLVTADEIQATYSMENPYYSLALHGRLNEPLA
jgi:RimJ/RimL family protein N-acetyltransferase